MGFNSVYKVLQEVFPQIDIRILKAVAIEHSKDADAAVEAVIVEVIPTLSEPKDNHSNNKSSPGPSLDGGSCLPKQSTEASSSDNNGDFISASEALDADSSGKPGSPTALEPANFHDMNEETNSGGYESEDEPLSLKRNGVKSKANSDGASSARVSGNVFYDNHDQECGNIGSGDRAWSDKSEVNSAEVSGAVLDETSLQVNVTPVASEGQLVVMSEKHLAVSEELDPNSFSKAMSEKDAFATEMVNQEDVPAMSSSAITRSDQVCSTKLLEDIIEDARNNKRTLVSTMDSVISLMREVECKERAAEQAKEEVSWGCSDILAKVDELKQALRHAKEANDMHAGEVYAEKAILATELKELQLRLLGLSDERDKALGVLNEMHAALEMRLAASLKEIEAAEKEKLEREKSARAALAYEERQMEKVVEESKRLKLEAEENSKLQDFLTDRGRAIDVLQGEIFVKCQDVKLLKEKFDKRIPLGRSLSSSQASSVLASSSSSLRSFSTPDPEPETHNSSKKNAVDVADSYGFLEKTESAKPLMFEGVSSVDDHFHSGSEQGGYDSKLLLDDGWELFDKADASKLVIDHY